MKLPKIIASGFFILIFIFLSGCGFQELSKEENRSDLGQASDMAVISEEEFNQVKTGDPKGEVNKNLGLDRGSYMIDDETCLIWSKKISMKEFSNYEICFENGRVSSKEEYPNP